MLILKRGDSFRKSILHLCYILSRSILRLEVLPRRLFFHRFLLSPALAQGNLPACLSLQPYRLMPAKLIFSRLCSLCYVLLSVAIALSTGFSQDSQAAGEADIRVDDTRFHIEIAQTIQERQQGLMFRTQLPADHGMLFIQPEAARAAFWMKNTYIPLDLLYFDSTGRLQEIHAAVPPCTVPTCPSYVSNGPIKYILEINAGSAQRLGLKPGAQLHLQ